ncbi:MAG: hypothetical protein HC871_12965 [Rhizobiales bacterium]|nr:hypothetical protein [Hyphomicrobiales bacterium]
MQNNESKEVVEATVLAIRSLLRPLATAMIKVGLTFPMFNNLAREAFVEAAREDFAVDGEPPSQSRIAILSGVHRKEVRRLAELDQSMPEPPSALPLSAKVVAVWTGDPAYLDAERRPRLLPRTAPDNGPSFERLVSSVSKDVRPRALLDEWVRQGMATIDGDVVRLLRQAFLPTDGYQEKAYFFGRNLRDHIAAGAHNLAGYQPSLFDRAVYYDRLKPASIEELRQFAIDKSMQLLLEVNQKASDLAARDRRDGDGGYRFTLGAFFFSTPTDRPHRVDPVASEED